MTQVGDRDFMRTQLVTAISIFHANTTDVAEETSDHIDFSCKHNRVTERDIRPYRFSCEHSYVTESLNNIKEATKSIPNILLFPLATQSSIITQSHRATIREVYMRSTKEKTALRNHDPPLTINSATVYNPPRISGVIATESHGPITNSSIMPDQLCSMKIVTASGEVREFSKEISESEYNVAKLNSGLLGIIYSATFRVQPMYNLRMSDTFYSINEWLNPKNLKDLLDLSDDQIWVKTFVRTDDPASFTQQQLEQSLPNQTQKAIQHFGNTSFVYQVPDAMHYVVSEESIKLEIMEIAFKADPDLSNVVAEY
ncbi:12669_t:CDS:2, partial [Gigaspora rosea]